MSGHLRPIPEQLEVVPLIDPVVEAHGFAPLHPYVEICYLPVLGPTSTLIYRRLGTLITEHEDGLTIDTADLASSMGIREELTRNAPLARSLGRLSMFGAAEWRGDAYAVRRALGPVPERFGLTGSSARAHRRLVQRHRHLA